MSHVTGDLNKYWSVLGKRISFCEPTNARNFLRNAFSYRNLYMKSLVFRDGHLYPYCETSLLLIK